MRGVVRKERKRRERGGKRGRWGKRGSGRKRRGIGERIREDRVREKGGDEGKKYESGRRDKQTYEGEEHNNKTCTVRMCIDCSNAA